VSGSLDFNIEKYKITNMTNLEFLGRARSPLRFQQLFRISLKDGTATTMDMARIPGTPKDMMYSSVVSHDTVHLFFLLAALNDLEIKGGM
jgi:hypothetical protein